MNVRSLAVTSGREPAQSEEAEQRDEDLPSGCLWPGRVERRELTGQGVVSVDGVWTDGGAWLTGARGGTPQRLVQQTIGTGVHSRERRREG